MDKNIFQQQGLVSRSERELLAGHKSAVLWFTGLSGAGKSTLAHAVELELYALKCRTYVIDGDNVRHGLCADLGFSLAERRENIRRVGELSKLFLEAGVITLAAFISPFQSDRTRVRNLFNEGEFIEIYCNAGLNICEQRDTKGLYIKARTGELPEFTGISSPYEPPLWPDLIVNTGDYSIEQCVNTVLDHIIQLGILK